MARYEFKLPDIGEGVTEGEIVKWLVEPGEDVTEDQPMVEVMTDKATVTITSPRTGKITELRGDVGSVVPVHSVLVVFDLGGGGASADAGTSPAEPAGTEQPKAAAKSPSAAGGAPRAEDSGPAATAVGDIKESLPGMGQSSGAGAASNGRGGAPSRAENGGGYYNEKPLATPATRKLARELDVDLRTVRPSGPHDRVTTDDIRAQAEGGDAAAAGTGPSSPAAASSGAAGAGQHRGTPPIKVEPLAAEDGRPSEERTPLRGMRKRIFESMARSKHTAAHFTFVEECDVTALKALRARLKPAAEAKGVKLTFLPFFVKACVAALKAHPTLNSAFDESTQEIVTRHRYNIGIAAATDAGLMVPVLHDADRLSLLDVAREIDRLGTGAREGKLSMRDLTGSTFTITSLGTQGGLFATPVLNFPEVAILGIHQMKQKPVVRDGQIVIGDVMLVSLSFDHRIIDGHIGAAFAYEVISFLQDPDRLFLEMA